MKNSSSFALLLITFLFCGFSQIATGQRYDPLDEVIDRELSVTDETIRNLENLLNEESFSTPNFPYIFYDVLTDEEKKDLDSDFDEMLLDVIQGIKKNPSKKWFFKTVQPYLEKRRTKDTVVREQFYLQLEIVMLTLGIVSSDGMLFYY